ncbi:MAG: DUF882 domain-containing protein [Gemmatimonadetes bacterium]|nr:DUF882 domain-containing protein [Gemmatimonadota bacterium]
MSGPDRSGWRKRLAWLESPGLSSRQERGLHLALVGTIVLFAGGWAFAIAGAAAGDERLLLGRELTANPLSANAPPPAAFVLDRLVRMAADEGRWRGESGAVRALITEPGDSLALADTLGLDSLPAGTTLEVVQADTSGARPAAEEAVRSPGAWNVLIRARDNVRRIAGFSVLTPVPSSTIRNGRIGQYLIGEWPSTAGRRGPTASERYAPPRGLIAVTPSNVDLPITDHLVLGDFLTKGQENVWPKYVVISPRVLDKFELTLQEMGRRGNPVEKIGMISAFRTPNYNAHGGNTGGRGSLSRHMYGDAIDFYIDNDGNGAMDDLNGDGRVDRKDGQVIADAAEAVEKAYPQYIGGIGVYNPNPGAHSGFVHLDTRGYRARW